MTSRQRPLGFMVIVILVAALALLSGFSQPVRADSEDVAMFYDDLSQYGQWVEYEKYGPVWRPGQVQEDWRPYTNGRWVPTDDGYVFESEEPWGWATYHYGNWMPTEGHGWVWVPGRTWYPSTVEWRTSPESEPVETSYVGWAPMPPPDYTPPPSYAPPSYYAGSPVTDTLTAPLWIFARAASFLLGFGQPYTPAYSYMNSGVLVPPAYVPVFYPQTVIVQRYFTPTYYPPAFYGRRGGFGAYSWGPPVGYISRVTRINQTVINQTTINNSVHITNIRNVVPSRAVMDRHRYLNQIVPPALAQGRRLPPPRQVQDIRQARVNLNRPNLLGPPRDVPRVTAQIPRVQPAAVRPGQGIPGTALPPRATMQLTPQMQQQIQKLPPKQRIEPGKPLPFKPATATQPGPAPPGGQAKPGQVQPGGPAQPGQVQRGAPTRPGGPAAGPAKPGEFHPGAARPGATPPGRAATPGTVKPGAAPLPPGYKGLTPEQRRQQEIEHQRLQRGGTPGQTQPQQQQQRQLQQERLQQQQQQRQRDQQLRQQQDRGRQQQIQQQQQQRQREQQMRQQQQQRQQQERGRQQQLQQQQQRQPQEQIKQQQQQQRQIQPQQQRQPQPQVQPQQRQPQQRQQPQQQQQQQRQEEKKKHELQQQ